MRAACGLFFAKSPPFRERADQRTLHKMKTAVLRPPFSGLPGVGDGQPERVSNPARGTGWTR
jgi:hypothetical protein